MRRTDHSPFSGRFPLFFLCAGGLAAGVCNGLLGTGGGILIIGALRLYRRFPSVSERAAVRGFGAKVSAAEVSTAKVSAADISARDVSAREVSPKDDYVTALCCMLPLSLLSSLLYLRAGAFSGVPFSRALPYFLGAVPGGVLGAYLLDRVKPKTAQLLFALLVVFGGARMAFS